MYIQMYLPSRNTGFSFNANPCLEKWLFQEERCQLADQWHHTAGERKGSLIKLGMLCEIRCFTLYWLIKEKYVHPIFLIST